MAKCTVNPQQMFISETPFISSVTVYDLLVMLSSAFTIVGSAITAHLIYGHATNYTKPREQKQIIRILLIVPIFSLCFTLGTVFYRSNVYFASVYEAYESLAIVAFFLLLCQYIQPNLRALRNYFAETETKPWIIVVRFFMIHLGKNKRGVTADGFKWLKIIWVGVVQFAVVKILISVLKCITEATNVYCDHSKDVKYASIWLMIFGIFSVAGAMTCLFQFFYQSREILFQHQAVLKFLAIKLVVIVFYTEGFIFDQLLGKDGPINPSQFISYASWSVGIPNCLSAFQMTLLSIMHLWAYPFGVYKVKSLNEQLPGLTHQVETIDTAVMGDGSANLETEPSGAAENRSLAGWRALVDTINLMDVAEATLLAAKYLVGR
ncbi:unnamed protein product [Clonostachys byssicola]|uniref:Uncharacterized protein n=1 Tax=Clonostachys byssicola TaxID=160290 RepID=A0A9N9URN0_9HYPO|nr:unnamed protein product [Clonostachys byssicola]